FDGAGFQATEANWQLGFYSGGYCAHHSFIHTWIKIDIFADEIEEFDIHRSTVDLWGTVLIRVSLLFGASTGVFFNRRDGPRRVSNLGTLVALLCLSIMTYALTKLLMLSEEGALMFDPWFISLFTWTFASAVAVMISWKLLSKTPNVVSDREDSEETERLVEDVEEEQKKEHPNSGATIGRLLSYCKKDSGLLAFAFFFLLLSAVCEAFIPYYTGKAIDGIVIQKSMESFAKPMITLTVLALVSSIAIGFRGGVFSVTFARLNVRLRNLLFRSLMQQDIGFFDANHTGDITSRLTSDTTQVSDLISQNVNLFLRSFVKTVGIFIFMFGMSWKLTVVTIMGFPYIAKLTKEVQTALAQANKVAEETISAMRTVRSFANENQEGDMYYSRLQEMFVLNKKQAVAFACFMWSSYISELALQVAILFYGGHLVVTNQMSGGTLISFVIYELELGEALASISSVYTGLMQGVGAAEKVFEYIDRKPKHALDGKEAPETFEGKVEFKNVTFAYPTQPEMDILKNFYAPQQGQVLVDGRPVNSYQHKYYHSKVALVAQEPVLFARSVQMNISYGLPEVPMETVIKAAINANAHDFITDLSKGYDSGVGEKGTQLSGGQKQRVAIARALIRNPSILILDEATSALDAESEYIVQQALNNLMREHTVLVIAHRLSTVERADNILVIDKGTVVEQGPHVELMAKGGLYCKLVQRQILGLELHIDEKKLLPAPTWERKAAAAETAEDCSNTECSYTLTQINELLEDDEKLSKFIDDSEEIKELQQNKEMTLTNNRLLAEQNLQLQPRLELQKNELTGRYQTLQDQFEAHQLRRSTLDHRSGNMPLDTLLALLQAEGAKIEEETENMADAFLDGEVALDVFIDEYQSKRKLAHLRRVKIEKLQEMVLKGHHVSPAAPQAFRAQDIPSRPAPLQRELNGSPMPMPRRAPPLPPAKTTPTPAAPPTTSGPPAVPPPLSPYPPIPPRVGNTPPFLHQGYPSMYMPQPYGPPLPQRPSPRMAPQPGFILQ
ncbi:hypothetical protein DNTS_031910, partial [Danionella cerebrum]